MERPRGFDLKAFAWGSCLSAAASVACASGLLYLSHTSSDPHVGPTAATLGDALSTIVGAALGLAIGSFVTAFYARSSRVATGVLAAMCAYVVVLLPVLATTDSSNVSASEILGAAIGLGALAVVVVSIAAAFGASGGHLYRSLRRRATSP